MQKKLLDIHLQVVEPCKNLPAESCFLTWVNAAIDMCHIIVPDELTIRVVSTDEIQQLNKTYRKHDKPTNILSFSDEPIPGCPRKSMGELVVCPQIIKHEAQIEKKTLSNHWAHIIVHGTLHLLGYTHDTSLNANKMEDLEIKILNRLNIPNPYKPS